MNLKLFITLATLGVIAFLCLSYSESATSFLSSKQHRGWNVAHWKKDPACTQACQQIGGVICGKADKECCAPGRCGEKGWWPAKYAFCHHTRGVSASHEALTSKNIETSVCSVENSNRK